MGIKYDQWKYGKFYLIDGKGNKLKVAEPITLSEIADTKYTDIFGYGIDNWEDEFTFTIKTSNKRAIRLWRRLIRKRYKHECYATCKYRWSIKAYLNAHNLTKHALMEEHYIITKEELEALNGR